MSPDRFTVDHLTPRSLGGSDEPENLALACHRCNGRRYTFTVGVDPETETTTPLFQPRQQRWADHFAWTADGTKIVGLTAIGRSTCQRLDLNDERYGDELSIQQARQLWVLSGWHPPDDDPQLN